MSLSTIKHFVHIKWGVSVKKGTVLLGPLALGCKVAWMDLLVDDRCQSKVIA